MATTPGAPGAQAIPSSHIDFCTMGMFIIDDIEFEPPKPPARDVMGGAASFAAVGARLVAGKEHSETVAWIVDAGSDFPPEIRETIRSWDTSCMVRETSDRLTTRAWNGYGPNEKRDFKYTTPKKHLNKNSLPERLLMSKTFHMVCAPGRCKELLQGIVERRNTIFKLRGFEYPRPIFVWEPVPNLCTPEELQGFYEAAHLVDVLSPNALELAGFFGKENWDGKDADSLEIVKKIISSGIGPNGKGLLIVRAGKDGSYTYCQDKSFWLPAYHESGISNDSPVVDPTGAGNAFLGALAQAMVSEGRTPIEAAKSELAGSRVWSDIVCAWDGNDRVPLSLVCATVAASYVVEQVGLPQISPSKEREDLWNGTSFSQRIHLYIEKMLRVLEKSTQ